MKPKRTSNPGRVKPRGVRARFHTQRLYKTLARFGYVDGEGADTCSAVGFRSALRCWERFEKFTKNHHTVDKVIKGKIVSHDTREEMCRMLHRLAERLRERPDVQQILSDITPDYFILHSPADELHSQVEKHLQTLSRGLSTCYYTGRGGWSIYESLARTYRLLVALSDHIDPGSSDRQLLRVGRLAHAWLEAAHLAGTESPAKLRWVHRLGLRAAGQLEGDSKAEVLLGLLAHSSPLDAAGRQAVSGMTWHRPSDHFDDQSIELSVLKHNRGRANYLSGVGGREDDFSARQIILGARLKVCSNDESKTGEAERDLAHAAELQSGMDHRTQAQFHLARHYWHSRRLTGRGRRSSLRSKQVESIHRVRDHYDAVFGSVPNLYSAACDIRLAEVSPSFGADDTTRDLLVEAVRTILRTPFDRCCVTDLSGVFDGTSPIYEKIDFDPEAIQIRVIRQENARRSR